MAAGETLSSERKPWMSPDSNRYDTSTSASMSRFAYAAPSSRSGSCSAVTTMAGGRPRRFSTASGLTRGSARIALVRDPLLGEEPSGIGGQAPPGRLLGNTRLAEGEIGVRIDQHLKTRPLIGVAKCNRDKCTQVASGAITRYRDDPCAPELVCVRESIANRSDGILDRGRPPILGRKAVRDGEDRDVADAGKASTNRVVGIEVASRPSPTVEVHDERPGGHSGPIEPHGDRCGDLDNEIRDRFEFRPPRTCRSPHSSRRTCAGDSGLPRRGYGSCAARSHVRRQLGIGKRPSIPD